jgi:drug/metabolite transporter (DMT)-like permease
MLAAMDASSSSQVRPSARPLLLAILAVYLLWGSTYLAIRVALETLPPLLLGAGRFLLAGGALYLALRLAGAPAPTPTQWRASAGTGVLLFLVGNGFVCLGEQWVSSGVVALVVGTMPLWAALLGALAGARPSPREWWGTVLGFVGVALLQAGGELGEVGPRTLVVVLAPIGWALGVVWGRRLPLPPGPMAAATQMLAGGAALLATAVLVGERLPAPPSARSLLALLWLVVFGSIVGFTAYGYLLRRARPAVANSYAFVNPIVALLLGATLAGEPLAPTTLLSAAVIAAGVLVIVVRPRGA